MVRFHLEKKGNFKIKNQIWFVKRWKFSQNNANSVNFQLISRMIPDSNFASQLGYFKNVRFNIAQKIPTRPFTTQYFIWHFIWIQTKKFIQLYYHYNGHYYKQMSPVKRNVARLKDALWVEPRFQLNPFLDENFKSLLEFGIEWTVLISTWMLQT